MTRRGPAPDGLIVGMLILVAVFAIVVSGVGQAIDWCDRRACRRDGGGSRRGRAEQRVALRQEPAVMPERAERRTGLNSYVVRLSSGEFIYDAATARRGMFKDEAQIWLWEPERTEAEVAALAKRLPWVGITTAVRARP